MATTPTNLPVPSESPFDFKFNIGKIDEVVTSMGWTYTDRFGVQHYTIEGMRWLAQQAIAAFGYITLDSFEDGNTLTLPNQVLRLEATGEYYRWDGAFPKDVPAGSTPDSTGGVGVGKWLSVGDATLRSDLEKDTGADIPHFKQAGVTGAINSPISTRFARKLDAVADFGADPTGATDSYAALQAWADACTAHPYITATINGIFKVSQPITFVGLQGLTIVGNCFIYPTYTSGTHVLGFKNGAGLRIYGRVEASGVNLLGIQAACKLWSDSSGISFSYLYGLIGSYALVGIQFGDLAYPGALVSEMSLMGGNTVGTPCAVREGANKSEM